MKMRKVALTVCLSAMLIGNAAAGVKGKLAPELRVDEWVNLPQGQTKGPKLKEEWKGKVVYLYFFQSWCPGCHSSGFPTLKALEKEFGSDEQVRFAAVQTVFEGFGTNTIEAAKKIVTKYKLEGIPVGQSGKKSKESLVMADFQTRGTPWTVVIGKDGTVHFEGFHLQPKEGKRLLKRLKKE